MLIVAENEFGSVTCMDVNMSISNTMHAVCMMKMAAGIIKAQITTDQTNATKKQLKLKCDGNIIGMTKTCTPIRYAGSRITCLFEYNNNNVE